MASPTEEELNAKKAALVAQIDKLIDAIMESAQIAAQPIGGGYSDSYRQMWERWLEKRRDWGSRLEQLKKESSDLKAG